MNNPNTTLENDLSGILATDLPWERLYGSHVLVTGAAGFIGGHVIELLAWLNRSIPQAGLKIHALARDLQKLQQRLPWLDLTHEITPLICDVTQPLPPGTKADFIIHTASPASPRFYLKQPVETILANTEGTKQLLELAKQQQSRLLFLSSGAVYGENSLQIDAIRETDFGSEDPLSPRACYSESKRLAETLCRAFYTQYAVDTRIARVSHCYGPGMRLDDGRVVTDLLADILKDKDVELESDGSASRPFCYLSDTVSGLFYILLNGNPGEVYNVGETKETTILELAYKMIAAAGKSGCLNVRANTKSSLPTAPRSSGHFVIDKIKNLGWAPHISLDVGLERTVRYYK